MIDLLRSSVKIHLASRDILSVAELELALEAIEEYGAGRMRRKLWAGVRAHEVVWAWDLHRFAKQHRESIALRADALVRHREAVAV